MKIYTKTGDEGMTGLLGGDRVSKGSLRIQAIGDLDELNAIMGVVRLYSRESSLDETLEQIQNWLFDIGAELASPPGGKFAIESIQEGHVHLLERAIDQQTDELEPLKAFILPGGSSLSANLHLARSVCRRVERSVLTLHEESPIRETLRRFLNRLSDYLFVASRTANAETGVQDVKWKKMEVH